MNRLSYIAITFMYILSFVEKTISISHAVDSFPRFLVKSFRDAGKGQPLNKSVSYLIAQPASTHAKKDLSNQGIVYKFGHFLFLF